MKDEGFYVAMTFFIYKDKDKPKFIKAIKNVKKNIRFIKYVRGSEDGNSRRTTKANR